MNSSACVIAFTAGNHLRVLELGFEQSPQAALDGEILARADSAGATHDFAFACRETDIRFSLGYPIHPSVRDAVLALPQSAWQQALNADGEPREGARVAELTTKANLDGWPEGTRLIGRRERPHRPARSSRSRPGRPPLPVLHHRPHRRRHRCARDAPPPARRGRGPRH